MSMMSYDAWRVSEPRLSGMNGLTKKMGMASGALFAIVLRTRSQIIHQVAFTRSSDHDHP